MSEPIASYALLGNLRCAALVSRAGSIDWLCPSSFDAPACFAALLGSARHGHWRIAPVERAAVRRRYQPDTLVLETEFATGAGRVRMTDAMPIDRRCRVLRRVEGLAGRVDMQQLFVPRFDYGRVTPDFCSREAALIAAAGNERLYLRSPFETEVREGTAACRFEVREGQVHDFSLAHCRSEEPPPGPLEVSNALTATRAWWREWIGRAGYEGPWREAVRRSLIVLKALIYAPTGGMVAAPTSSLPEAPGADANWDYRYCWLRDATLVLDVLIRAGYRREAGRWCGWLLRATGQAPTRLQSLYTIGGCEFVPEHPAEWLPGYAGSRPVRIGNAASGQFQMDLRGELIDTLHLARRLEVPLPDGAWALQRTAVERLEQRWSEPDAGIWESRRGAQHYTHSKIMAWLAIDRSIRDAERHGFEAPLPRWRHLRETIRSEVLARGTGADGALVQSYGSEIADASLLMVPLLGFLPATDPHVTATVARVERELCEEGFVYRYPASQAHAGREGSFHACSFWLVDNYALSGRRDEAEALFERLLDCRNDVGLLSEEYDPKSRTPLGNVPQSLSHLALVNSARLLCGRDEVHRSGP